MGGLNMSFYENKFSKNFFWVKLFMHGLYRKNFTKTPIFLTLFVTSRCNERCKHCFYLDKINSKQKNELNLGEIEKISLSMDNIDYLYLTGGEPFLRKDLSEIAYFFYKNTKAKLITIPTNGYFTEMIYTETKKILDKCEKSLIILQLSVDGIHEDHDRIRSKGAFNNLIKTYYRLYELQKGYRNLIITFNLAFSKENQHSALEVFNFMKNNLKFNNFGTTLIRGNVEEGLKDISIDKYKELVNEITDSENDNIKGWNCLFHWIIKKRRRVFYDMISNVHINKKRQFDCSAGSHNATIYEEGNTHSCELINKKMGSLRDNNYDFKKVWFNEEAQKIRNYIKKRKCYCTHESNMWLNVNFSFIKMFNLISGFNNHNK